MSGSTPEPIIDAQRICRLAETDPGTSKAGRRSMRTTSTLAARMRWPPSARRPHHLQTKNASLSCHRMQLASF